MKLNGILRNYFLSHFFYDFVFAYAIYTALFALNGISIFQISILLAVWSLSSVMFEIPSGALADCTSRRNMLIYAPLIKALCFIIWIFAGSNFYLYLIGFIIWSLASSFKSGTSEAYLYDTLSDHEKSDQYEKYSGRRSLYTYLSLAIAILIGGFLAQVNVLLPLVFSVVPLAVSTLFASRLPEATKKKSTGEVKYFSYIKFAFAEVRSKPVFIYLFIYTLILAGIMGNLEEFDLLYYQLVNLPFYGFGIAGFFWAVLSGLASNYAYKLKNYSFIYYLLAAISGIFLLLVSRFPSIPIIVLLELSYAVIAPVRVLVESRVQREITGISRATTTSIVKFLEQGFGIILVLIFGLISRKYNLPAIYLAAGLTMILFSIWSFGKRRIWKDQK